MANRKTSQVKATPARLRKVALSLPDAIEATSCNKAAFKAGSKNFLFLGEGTGPEAGSFTTMLKLTEADSLAEATKLSKSQPDNFSLGKNGWLSSNFQKGEGPPAKLFEAWIEESYRALAPKKLAAQLD